MAGVVDVSGNPRAVSRTSVLAVAVGAAIAERRGVTPLVVEVGELRTGLVVAAVRAVSQPGVLLTPGDAATASAVAALSGAEVLVVASPAPGPRAPGRPTYKGSYTGVLKVLLDQLPARALAGTVAVPVVTAGVDPQADAALALLRRLLGELGADVADGLPVVESQLAESAVLAGKYAAARDW